MDFPICFHLFDMETDPEWAPRSGPSRPPRCLEDLLLWPSWPQQKDGETSQKTVFFSRKTKVNLFHLHILQVILFLFCGAYEFIISENYTILVPGEDFTSIIYLIYFQNGLGSNNVSSCHQGPGRPGTNHPPLKPSMKLQETSFSKHKLCNEKNLNLCWRHIKVFQPQGRVNQQHISGVSRPWPTHQRVLAHKTSRTSRRKKRRNTMVSLLLVNMIMTPTTKMMMIMIMIMTMDLPGIWPTCLAPINEAKW